MSPGQENHPIEKGSGNLQHHHRAMSKAKLFQQMTWWVLMEWIKYMYTMKVYIYIFTYYSIHIYHISRHLYKCKYPPNFFSSMFLDNLQLFLHAAGTKSRERSPAVGTGLFPTDGESPPFLGSSNSPFRDVMWNLGRVFFCLRKNLEMKPYLLGTYIYI